MFPRVLPLNLQAGGVSSRVPTHWERQVGQSQGPILLGTMVGLGLAHVMGWSIKPPPSPALLRQQMGTTGFLLPKCELIKTLNTYLFWAWRGPTCHGRERRWPILKERQKQTELTDGGDREITR